MASSSGGKSDFVQEGDSIAEKVIPQLESSLSPSLIDVEIHLEGEKADSFMVSPFPIQPINSNGASIVYLRGEKKSFDNGMLVNGMYGRKQVDIVIDKIDVLNKIDEDKFGCCGGKNIANSISPLFAFSFIKSIEKKRNVSEADKKKAVEISISSGVLCKYTGYVGMTDLGFDFSWRDEILLEGCQDSIASIEEFNINKANCHGSRLRDDELDMCELICHEYLEDDKFDRYEANCRGSCLGDDKFDRYKKNCFESCVLDDDNDRYKKKVFLISLLHHSVYMNSSNAKYIMLFALMMMVLMILIMIMILKMIMIMMIQALNLFLCQLHRTKK